GAAQFRAAGITRVFTDGVEFRQQYDVSGSTQAGDERVNVGDDSEIIARASSLADIGGLRASAHGSVRENHPTMSLNFNATRNASGRAIGTYELAITGPSGSVTTS